MIMLVVMCVLESAWADRGEEKRTKKKRLERKA